jgi:hypothetical protein
MGGNRDRMGVAVLVALICGWDAGKRDGIGMGN